MFFNENFKISKIKTIYIKIKNIIMTKIKLKESELRNIIQKVIKESTDLDKYEDVVFLQGEEADEALDILNNEGKDAAMDYLIQWHDPGHHMGKNELGIGSSDQTYRRDGYIMSWNSSFGYIGLDYDLSMMNESMFDGVSVNGNFNVDAVLESYLETLLWVDEELDGRAIIDIAPESVQKAKKDVELFISKINENPQAQEEAEAYDDKSLGHNLALSRNGHGAGFFDEYNDTLQDIARGMGESDIYIGDDGILYIYPDSVNESKKKRKNMNEKKRIISELDVAGTYPTPETEPSGYDVNTKFIFPREPKRQYMILRFENDGLVVVKDLYENDVELFSTKSLNDMMSDGTIQIVNESKKKRNKSLKESIPNYHEGPTPSISPSGYQIGDIYYYTDDNILRGIMFKIEDIQNGAVSAYSEDSYQDHPSTNELNNYLQDGSVRIKQNNTNESKKTTKIKLSELKKLIESVIVEELGDNEFNVGEPEEEFVPHGSYTVSNSGGYLIMISDDGDYAKVKDAFGSENPEISDWLEIEYIEDEDEPGELMAVIDPEGYNIPLNQVMRINR